MNHLVQINNGYLVFLGIIQFIPNAYGIFTDSQMSP